MVKVSSFAVVSATLALAAAAPINHQRDVQERDEVILTSLTRIVNPGPIITLGPRDAASITLTSLTRITPKPTPPFTRPTVTKPLPTRPPISFPSVTRSTVRPTYTPRLDAREAEADTIILTSLTRIVPKPTWTPRAREAEPEPQVWIPGLPGAPPMPSLPPGITIPSLTRITPSGTPTPRAADVERREPEPQVWIPGLPGAPLPSLPPGITIPSVTRLPEPTATTISRDLAERDEVILTSLTRIEAPSGIPITRIVG